MRSRGLTLGLGLIAVTGLVLLAAAPPAGLPFTSFNVTILADGLNQPKGLDFATHQAGAGVLGREIVVAESGANQLLTVYTDGSGYEVHATDVGSFPVGLACYGGPYGRYMFIGSAFSMGILRCDAGGTLEQFALPGMDIAGLDFGKGKFDGLLYGGEWAAGNVYRIMPDGTSELFVNIPGTQTRYIRFSPGGAFGEYLYTTDFGTGDIYRVAPDGSWELFASTGAAGIEGLNFSRGGAFGRYLYTANLTTGEIHRVDADGSVELWADGFDGAADLVFKPGGPGGFTMYMVDGVSKVYKISRMGIVLN